MDGNIQLNVESAADTRLLADDEPQASMTFNLKAGPSTGRIKRKLDEFVLVSTMYDQLPDYKAFAKTLITGNQKSSVGL